MTDRYIAETDTFETAFAFLDRHQLKLVLCSVQKKEWVASIEDKSPRSRSQDRRFGGVGGSLSGALSEAIKHAFQARKPEERKP